jgi:hypothetical protein
VRKVLSQRSRRFKVDTWPPNGRDDDDDWPVPDGPPTVAGEQFAALVGEAWEAGQRRDLFEEPY